MLISMGLIGMLISMGIVSVICNLFYGTNIECDMYELL
jgi:hypothetical protein